MALESSNLFRLPFFGIGGGLSTEFGAWLPKGSKAIFVRSTGVQSQDEQSFARKILPTLASGLLECRAGMGDTVFVLPGHSESVTDNTMLTNLVAGTRVIGLGHPLQSDAPTFRWTNTAGSWLVTVADCVFANLKLKMEGANGITKAINITAAGTTIAKNAIQTASGATAKAAIAIEVGSGALFTTINDNYIYGTATHNSTDIIKLVGSTVPSNFTMSGNKGIASITAGNGFVHVTVAALNCLIENNTLYNTHTASTACIAIDDVAADGMICYNNMGVLNDGTASAEGLVFAGSTDLFKCFQNFCSDEKNKSGLLSPGAAS